MEKEKKYEFKKIQLGKANTLAATYRNEDDDTVTVQGANVTHGDLRRALEALVPHLALLTEQKEAANKSLQQIRDTKDVHIDGGPKSCYDKMKVTGIVCGDNSVMIMGTRYLDSGFTVNVQSPKVDFDNEDSYAFMDDLTLDVEAVKYEAREYFANKKWGVIQTSLDFGEAGDPFEGEVKPDDVKEATVEVETKQHTGKKSKKKATA